MAAIPVSTHDPTLLSIQSELYTLQAIQMALLPAKVYYKLQRVFNMYKGGKLQGQKQWKMTQANTKKALVVQFSAKLYVPLQALSRSRG